jgi:hypothetical protein
MESVLHPGLARGLASRYVRRPGAPEGNDDNRYIEAHQYICYHETIGAASTEPLPDARIGGS